MGDLPHRQLASIAHQGRLRYGREDNKRTGD
jgi:hypothetical protein